MISKKFKCVSIEGLDFSRGGYKREVGEIFECLGVSYSGQLGIIHNPKSGKFEVWAMKGLEEIQ